METGSLQPREGLGPRRPGDLLEGWKAIADHLRKTERTVQRWEKSKGLPVRRLKTDSEEEGSRVYAYISELDTWWAERVDLERVALEEDKTEAAATVVTPTAPDPLHEEKPGSGRWRLILLWGLAA